MQKNTAKKDDNPLSKLMDEYAELYAIQLKKEIDRLKKIIEAEFKYGRPFCTNEEWEQFKFENNL